MNMTPEQKLKHAVILRSVDLAESDPPGEEITAENVDRVFEELNDGYGLQDAINEIRGSGTETGLPCEWSRHFEAKAVAAKMPDGTWVGWTYWYGGGKHARPEDVEWMADAYSVECQEEEKMVVVRTFTAI